MKKRRQRIKSKVIPTINLGTQDVHNTVQKIQETSPLSPITLKESPSTYKINISEDVESKIRCLCKEINTIEWSGILFYTVTGTFEKEDLEVNCVDVYPMDIGVPAFTEYIESSEIASYMAENRDLLFTYTGLIHSHNTMDTFFSGTDRSTLLKEGKYMPHFVSLIVNNAGVYTAAITRVLKTKEVISTVSEYRTFGGTSIEDSKAKDAKEEEYVEYSKLAINFIQKDSAFTEPLHNRLEEIKAYKLAHPVISRSSNCISRYSIGSGIYTPKNTVIDTQADLFDDRDTYLDENGFDYNYIQDPFSVPSASTVVAKKVNAIDYDLLCINDEEIASLGVKLLSGSITMALPDDKTLNNWVVTSMYKAFESVFPIDTEGERTTFDLYISAQAEFIVYNLANPGLTLKNYDEDHIAAIYANGLIKYLESFPTNYYIAAMINTLESYII